MSGFLLDTNVVSETSKPRPDPKVRAWFESVQDEEERIFISVLTLGEIRRGIVSLPSSSRKTRLELWFQDLLGRFKDRVLLVDEVVAERWGIITARTEAVGRPLPAVDSLMAATALHHNLTFVTRDTGELAITGVQLFNPWID